MASTVTNEPDRLLYFTTSPDGDRSTLWSADLEAPPTASGTLVRTRVEVVEHAPGYAPRGSLSADGSRTAWVVPPPGPSHGGPAELFVDGALVDESALYLQRPRFVGDALMYLRAWPGEDRVGADGRLRARRDHFELVARGGDEGRVVATWDGLWVQLCGTLPGLPGDPARGLIVLRIDDDGSELLELRADGSLRARWRLDGAVLRDVQPDPDGARAVWLLDRTAGALVRVPFDGAGEPATKASGLFGDLSAIVSGGGAVAVTEGEPGSGWWRVPERAVSSFGVLWREHGPAGMESVLETLDGRRATLAPPGDAAQHASVLGVIAGDE